MLPSRARRPEDIHLDILLTKVDLDGVVDVGINEYRRERGVAARLRVVRRYPNQPVDALLCLQIAIGIFTLDLDGNGLDARFLPRKQIEDCYLESMALGPAYVHPHQHFRLVL